VCGKENLFSVSDERGERTAQAVAAAASSKHGGRGLIKKLKKLSEGCKV
jgi:hypothetical protein